MAKVTYIVQAQGWGDSDTEWSNIAAFATLEEADAHMEQVTRDWVREWGDTEGLLLAVQTREVA